jgi:hypothetical protein
MLYLLAQDAPPESFGFLDVLVWPVGLTLVAWFVFYAGWWMENRSAKAPWKWISILPAAYAIYIGIDYVSKYQDPIYNNLIASGGRKMMFAHYGALIIPLLGLAGIVLFHFFNHKLNIATADD